jgi:hypothetical protein
MEVMIAAELSIAEDRIVFLPLKRNTPASIADEQERIRAVLHFESPLES